MTRSLEAVVQLREQINERAGMLIPTHVANRVALLLGGRAVQFVDAPLTREMFDLSGFIHVFTDRQLIIAELASVGLQPRHDSPWTGDVTVTALPRRSLISMIIEPASSEYRNNNSLWAGSEVLRWPNYCELRLRYEHHDQDVILGRPNGETEGQGTSPLDEFLDSLVADLSA